MPQSIPVLDFGGVTDIVTKIHTRSKNKLVMARATVEALKQLRARPAKKVAPVEAAPVAA